MRRTLNLCTVSHYHPFPVQNIFLLFLAVFFPSSDPSIVSLLMDERVFVDLRLTLLQTGQRSVSTQQ